MACPICTKGQPVAGFTSVKLARDEIHFTIERVPGYICPVCEETYLDEDTAIRLLTVANDMADEGLIEGTRDFESQ